jgi:hypothetical protein
VAESRDSRGIWRPLVRVLQQVGEPATGSIPKIFGLLHPGFGFDLIERVERP